MNNRQSPIEDLFSDTGPVDIKAVVEALKPLMQVQRGKNEIHLTELGNEAIVSNKILIYALGKKILKMESIIETEEFSAKEVFDNLGLKKGTIDFNFNLLRERGFILGSGSSYVIPNAKVSAIVNILKGIKKG